MSFRFIEFKVLVFCMISAPFYGQPTASWLGAFPDEIRESSGLLLAGNRFVTHNDSGNAPLLYELDTASLEVTRRVFVKGSPNTDWEALASDGQYFYIGDFGNNLGNRRDLRVLRISRRDFVQRDTVEAESITFSYEDQRTFMPDPKSDWDAEALLAGPDSLWIFTKQWDKKGTSAYCIPKTPGQHIARHSAEFAVGALVTGAAGSPGGESVLLLGYTAQLQPVLIVIPVPISLENGAGRPQKYLLSIGFAQTEGMDIGPEGTLYISSEAFSNRMVSLPGGIYKLDLTTETARRKEGETDPNE